MPPSNLSHIFMFAEVLFLSGTLYRLSNSHRRTQINRTELGQAQLGLAEKQMELAREQMELAQNHISATATTQIKPQKTQMELAQAQMALAQAQTKIAQQQMPLRESPPIQSSNKPFPWNILGERYSVQPASHRNHDPKVFLEHERIFQFPKGDFSGGYWSLVGLSLSTKIVISGPEV